MKDYLNTSSSTHFVFPIDGDCLNQRDGVPSNNGLCFTAQIASAPGSVVRVNDTLATEQNGIYTVRLHAKPGQNLLVAKNESNGTTATVSVYFLTCATGKYRISSDDNILFLADLTANQDTYTSLFDNPYLAIYKKAHDLYGAKVHLNLFYEFDRTAAEYFSSERPDFNLSMMTDKFKEEWKSNSDWLSLSFHARREWPEKPYQNASPETITEDYLAVRREVLRFAGEESFSSEVTTVHFGEANIPCVAALRDLGHKALAGYFMLTPNGEPLVSYYAPIPLIRHVGKRDFWRDTELGMTFACIDRVTNLDSLEDIMAELNDILANPHRSGFVSIMIHEQYFYADYSNHLADFEARLLEPAKLLYKHGYHGSFVRDVISETL